MLERLTIFFINLFFPPLSIALIAGIGPDFLINTLLLLAGVIPGHIHTFYLTCTISTENQKSKRADILDLPRAGSTVLRFGTVEQVTDVYTSYGCVNRTGKEEASEDVEEKKNDKKVPVIRNT